jgi:ribose-phosphate pyrophosphokinase
VAVERQGEPTVRLFAWRCTDYRLFRLELNQERNVTIMQLTILSGRANPALAGAVASALGVEPGRCTIEGFPDGELQVEVHDDLHGHDVYLIQPTSPPVSEHLMELLLLSDACRRAGAAHVAAVVPYFGYARQDRRVHGKEAVGARVVADLLSTRLERIVAMDLHNPAIEGFFGIPVEHLSAVPLLADVLGRGDLKDRILVAPDLGAVKLAQHYANLLKLPVAYIQKVRHSGTKVNVLNVVGDVYGRSPIVVDDMISTGGTMISAIEALLDEGCLPDITIAATHALMVGTAAQRFASISMKSILVTDSIYHPLDAPLPIERVSIAQVLADRIKRLHFHPAQ